MDSHHSSHLSAVDVFKELKELKRQQWQMKITMNRMEKGTYKCSSTELLLKQPHLISVCYSSGWVCPYHTVLGRFQFATSQQSSRGAGTSTWSSIVGRTTSGTERIT